MKEKKERYRIVGMDDFIARPFKMADLTTDLEKHLAESKRAVPAN